MSVGVGTRLDLLSSQSWRTHSLAAAQLVEAVTRISLPRSLALARLAAFLVELGLHQSLQARSLVLQLRVAAQQLGHHSLVAILLLHLVVVVVAFSVVAREPVVVELQVQPPAQPPRLVVCSAVVVAIHFLAEPVLQLLGLHLLRHRLVASAALEPNLLVSLRAVACIPVQYLADFPQSACCSWSNCYYTWGACVVDSWRCCSGYTLAFWSRTSCCNISWQPSLRWSCCFGHVDCAFTLWNCAS